MFMGTTKIIVAADGGGICVGVGHDVIFFRNRAVVQRGIVGMSNRFFLGRIEGEFMGAEFPYRRPTIGGNRD